MKNSTRRVNYDVTDSVDISSSQAVCQHVREIFCSIYPNQYFSEVERAFEDFDRLFEGEFEGYQACDTFYHDKQHSLDMTLALARLLEGHYQLNSQQPIVAEYAALALIVALYHDAGYIREENDDSINGAVYTRIHVSRSADFLSRYLSLIGLDKFTEIARNMVHYTGYELKPDQIELPEPILHTIGHMIGTADLIAQMSDRCYLEKCRDRLYPEFVLGDIATIKKPDGSTEVLYESGNDLLRKTPDFYNHEINGRLNNVFNGVYHLAEKHFGKANLYVESVENNISYLISLINQNNLESLKRIPLTNNGTLIASHTDAAILKQLQIK